MPAVTVNSLSDISCRCCSSRLRCLQSITLESSRAVELSCLWHGFGNIVNAVERVEVHVALPQHVQQHRQLARHQRLALGALGPTTSR